MTHGLVKVDPLFFAKKNVGFCFFDSGYMSHLLDVLSTGMLLSNIHELTKSCSKGKNNPFLKYPPLGPFLPVFFRDITIHQSTST